MEEKIELKGWVARDADGAIFHFSKKPQKVGTGDWWKSNGTCRLLPKDSLPSVKWSDPEPREATITITLK